MKRWAFLTALIYALALLLLTVPAVTADSGWSLVWGNVDHPRHFLGDLERHFPEFCNL